VRKSVNATLRETRLSRATLDIPIGAKFSRLTVVGEVLGKGHRMFKCICECGTIREVALRSLRAELTKSCGCFQKERARECSIKHGGSGSRIHECWHNMKKRASARDSCEVFPDWLDFEVFKKWASSNGYSDDFVLCREGDIGNYFPDNVRWDTKANNVRESQAELWEITTPEGEVKIIYNLAQYCRENDLDPRCMSAIARGYRGRKCHKGYTNVKKVEKLNLTKEEIQNE